MKTVIVATKNVGKAKEFQSLFEPFGIEVKTLLDYPDAPDVDETGTTFEENALLKAEETARELQVPVLADDSGLVVEALNGEPGVYSARYAGLEKSDAANNAKVLEKLKDVQEEQRDAYFCCVLAVAKPSGETLTVEGRCEGRIGYESRGTNGFGYDPIFVVKGTDRTMAEHTKEEKNSISHRAQALKKLDVQSLVRWLEAN